MLPPLRGSARAARDVITEDALFVHPAVVGLPLARPWRRACAMAIDGVIVAFLAQAPGILFALVTAYVLFRASGRSGAGAGYVRTSVRFALRSLSALLLFAMSIAGWDSASDRFQGAFASLGGGVEARSGEEEGDARGVEAMGMAVDFLAFQRAEDPRAARQAGEQLVTRMRAEGAGTEEIREILTGVSEGADEPWRAAVADSLLGAVERAEPAPAALDADSLERAYATALSARDTVALASLRPRLATTFASDTLGALGTRVVELEAERSRLRREVTRLEEAAERTGILGRLWAVAEDLGLGLGWIILYFTAMVGLWQGRTPGKKAMGIRVVRLNAKPISWWVAFERAGGYSAGLATGLLGFFQILWDRNRQGIHDKITETAVIRER